MLVFTTVAAAVSRYFPRYRNVSWLVLLLLGVALVATNYHFPGDVFAGAAFGVLLEWAVASVVGTERGERCGENGCRGSSLP